MSNPYAIQVHCDGAMDYDSNQTGGNGFHIEFPDSIDEEPISRSIRNDDQGIHRLEMISILEAIEELLSFAKINPSLIRKASAVEIYTDRFSVTDDELLNPYKIKEWRSNGWKNHEGADIKNVDLIDKIDKARIRLGRSVGGYVSISYKRRKNNRVANNLAKAAKKTENQGRKLIEKKKRQVIRRLYDGPEIKYSKINIGDEICARVYAWEYLKKEFEICFEITEDIFIGMVIKARVNDKQKALLHRGHFYFVEIGQVHSHHITISSSKENLTSDSHTSTTPRKIC